MNGDTTPGVSAGSNSVGASEKCSAHVIWPSGAASAPVEAMTSIASSAIITHRRSGFIMCSPSRLGSRQPRPVFGDGAGVHAQVEAGDHLGVVGGEEDGGAGVVAGTREFARGDHLGEV